MDIIKYEHMLYGYKYHKERGHNPQCKGYWCGVMGLYETSYMIHNQLVERCEERVRNDVK